MVDLQQAGLPDECVAPFEVVHEAKTPWRCWKYFHRSCELWVRRAGLGFGNSESSLPKSSVVSNYCALL